MRMPISMDAAGSIRSDDENGIKFIYPQETEVKLPSIETSNLAPATVGLQY
jgi:hypothetical protein